jgi:hypothetical protein
MKMLLSATALALFSPVAMPEQCTLAREEVSGENKFCFYKCLRGDQVLTIRALSQCPLMREFSFALGAEFPLYEEINALRSFTSLTLRSSGPPMVATEFKH